MRWAKSTCSVHEGMECVHCEPFFGKAPLSFVPFLPRVGSTVAEAARRLRSRRSQMELAVESERGIFHLASSAVDESKLLEEDVLSVTSSDPAGSAFLAHGGLMKTERISEPSQLVCPAYVELLEVMKRALLLG